MIKYLLYVIKTIKQMLIPKASVSSWDKYKNYVNIHPTAIIDPASTLDISNLPKKPRICVEIGAYSHIFSNISIQRPEARVKIGKNCQLGHSSIIAANSITIGDNVLMAWGCTLMDNDSHSQKWQDRSMDVKVCYQDYLKDRANFIKNKDWSKVPIKAINIKNKAWIGFNVSILKGVTVGKEAVIGACSVVVKNVADKTVVAGNPAKIIRTLP